MRFKVKFATVTGSYPAGLQLALDHALILAATCPAAGALNAAVPAGVTVPVTNQPEGTQSDS
jgi:hypothetical protein